MNKIKKNRIFYFIIVAAAFMFLATRLFAVIILDEPFFGERIDSWFNKKNEIADPGFFTALEAASFAVSGSQKEPGEFSFPDSFITDKEIIGVGESTHGTREFFEFKTSLFPYLVQRHGFRVFAIESDFTACQQINNYVLKGEGDIKILLRDNGMLTWNTNEILELIEWMRQYNSSLPDSLTVQFWGIDTRTGNLATNRDSVMADKVTWLRRNVGKTMVWSHNTHIGANPPNNNDYPTRMGQYLRDQWGHAYYNLAMVFGEGSFTSQINGKSTTGKMLGYVKEKAGKPSWRWDSVFASANAASPLMQAFGKNSRSPFFLSFNAIHKESSLAKGLQHSNDELVIGPRFLSFPASRMTENWWESFNGLIYFDKAHATKIL